MQPLGSTGSPIASSPLDLVRRLGRSRWLAKSFENTTTSATGWLQVASIATTLRHLSHDQARQRPQSRSQLHSRTARNAASECVWRAGVCLQYDRAVGRERGASLRTVRAGWNELPDHFDDASFDMAFCVGNSPHHAEGAGGRSAALESMSRLLRPGGRLVLTSRNWELVRAGGSQTHGRVWGAPARAECRIGAGAARARTTLRR